MKPLPKPIRSRLRLKEDRLQQCGDDCWSLRTEPRYYLDLFKAVHPEIHFHRSRGGNGRAGHPSRICLELERLTDETIGIVESFCHRHRQQVIIGLNRHLDGRFSDELDYCIALDYDFDCPQSRRQTKAYRLLCDAKYGRNPLRIRPLGILLARAVSPLLQKDLRSPVLITHIPSSGPKQGNLTSLLAGHVHEHIDLGERPASLVEMGLSQKKDALKDLDLERKRMEWERLFEAEAVSISDSVDDATVVVVDDLYQSGTTMWSFARYLKQQGARHVLGLVCVKTLRDTDNL